uniref:Uncharacterized protein n=1 Tax=Candidatus Kentrum sp. FW TaxID=2126338 RepID=A0A450TNF5_9GAMM|nr:MAG: hypothetical protein BECKFW1821C_GA0114237_101839 [Candidatus Kentron sp. FW]
MATFPSEENKILALGREISAGLKAHKDIFPNPPGDPKKLDAGEKACFEAIEASAAEQATANKNATIRAYADDLKSELRYAENTVNFDDLKLKTLGWGGRRERNPLTPPGRALDLRIIEEGEGGIRLRWPKPMDGGKPGRLQCPVPGTGRRGRGLEQRGDRLRHRDQPHRPTARQGAGIWRRRRQ